MELKEYIQLLRKHFKQILLTGIAFSVLGLVFFYKIPPVYVATGSFFVGKSSIAPSNEYFNYEGYYAQQSAISYTRTFAALLESVDIRSGALTKLGIPIKESNLRRISRYMLVKIEPQLVTLKVKGKTEQEASVLWNVLSSVSLETVETLNSKETTGLYITQVSVQPTVHMTFSNVYLNIFVGFLLGLMVSGFIVSYKNYMQGDLK